MKAASFERRHDRKDNRKEHRLPQQRDRDRLLYTVEFRRLAGVTQVVGPLEGPVFHNRLTHSLQVAQNARRLAERLIGETPIERLDAFGGLDPDVVEAAALAHDLGHPPFGHIAEAELNKLALSNNDPDGFEGNPQSFRIVTRLSAHYHTYPGLNLTRRTLNAILKYPWPKVPGDPKKERKFGAYRVDKVDFDFAREGFENTDAKSLEAEVMDLADSFVYSVHDFDDFYRAGLIPVERLRAGSTKGGPPKELQTIIASWIASGKIEESLLTPHLERVNELVWSLGTDESYTGQFDQRARLRETASGLLASFVNAVVLRTERDADGRALELPPEARVQVEFLQWLVRYYVIDSPRLGTQQHGQRRMIRALFRAYLRAIMHRDKGIVPATFHRELTLLEGRHHSKKPSQQETRLAVDIVAGMTDRQASLMYRRLTGIITGSIGDIIDF
jgi:dGTPase